MLKRLKTIVNSKLFEERKNDFQENHSVEMFQHGKTLSLLGFTVLKFDNITSSNELKYKYSAFLKISMISKNSITAVLLQSS